MKDITLKIVGKQCFDDKEENQVEFVTEGKLYLRNEAVYIVYEESKISGLEGCKTTLKIKDNTLKMRRVGEIGQNTELYFESGKRFSSRYETPYGPMEVEVLTNWVANKLDAQEAKGSINIEYDVSIQGLAEGKNRLTIDIM